MASPVAGLTDWISEPAAWSDHQCLPVLPPELTAWMPSA